MHINPDIVPNKSFIRGKSKLFVRFFKSIYAKFNKTFTSQFQLFITRFILHVCILQNKKTSNFFVAFLETLLYLCIVRTIARIFEWISKILTSKFSNRVLNSFTLLTLLILFCIFVSAMGIIPGPFDCALVTRSLKTLALRMKKHNSNALAIAQFLQTHPRILKVLHPGKY